MSTEFSRIIPLADIGGAALHTVEAGETERRALAVRFALRALDSLSGHFSVAAAPGGVRVTGIVKARAVQTCVISGEDVPAGVEEPVDLLFLHLVRTEDDEVELGEADCDVLLIEGRGIDLGEVAAQTLGLALDPYPHAESARLEAARRLLVSEEDIARRAEEAKPKANPFAVLKRTD